MCITEKKVKPPRENKKYSKKFLKCILSVIKPPVKTDWPRISGLLGESEGDPRRESGPNDCEQWQ